MSRFAVRTAAREFARMRFTRRCLARAGIRTNRHSMPRQRSDNFSQVFRKETTKSGLSRFLNVLR
jgi:hypothetical protein